MQLESLITFFSSTIGVIVISVAGLVFVIIAILLTNALLARLRTSQKFIGQSKKRAEEIAEEIVNQARQDAQHITLQANEKASELLRSARVFKTAAEKELDEALRKFIQGEIERLAGAYGELTGAYHVMAEEAHRTYLRNMEVASQKMVEDAHQSTVRLQQLLEEEITRFHTAIDERLSGWLDTAQKEIEDYKREKFRQIDESIFRIIFRVSQEVLSKPLDLEMHQDLVMKALREAKKEGFFRT